MVVTVFRARVRKDLDPALFPELQKRGARMYQLASSMPGFISYKDFSAADGESVSVIEFDTHENVLAWRNHPEHREVQQWGRDVIFSSVQIQVCDLVRTTRFP
jgi:heme-degrading monooxygenase HmoA